MASELGSTFVLAWAGTSLVFFGIGSYFDLKDRLIPDKVWLGQLLVGILIDLVWLQTDPSITLTLVALANLTLSLIIGIGAFLIGSLSGADMKALIVLAFSSPITFSLTSISLNLNDNFPSIFFFLLNFLLYMLFFIIYNIIRNVLTIPQFGPLFKDTKGSLGQKISVLISAWRIAAGSEMVLKHMDPAERWTEEEWQLYTPLFQELMEDEEYELMEEKDRREALTNIELSGRKFLWVRPQPPGIFFFLLAYLTLILIGSPLGFIFFFLT